jgi:hypothetical protein
MAPVVFSVIGAVVLVVPRRTGPKLKLVGIHVKRGVTWTFSVAVNGRVPLTLALAGHSALPLTFSIQCGSRDGVRVFFVFTRRRREDDVQGDVPSV